MKTWSRVSLCITLLVAASRVGSRAVAAPRGSDGTRVSCIDAAFVFSQDLVLAYSAEGGVVTGLYKATDGGWKLLPAPLSSEVRAAPDGTIYVYVGDLYRSTDGGETWDRMGRPPHRLIFPSPVPDMVFSAGAKDPVYGPGRIYKSTDGGATWEEVLAIEGARSKWVAFSPGFAIDGTAFAALDAYHASVGIWKTEDWGETWTKKSGGLAYGGTFLGHQWVAVSPQYPQDQTAFTSDGTGAYKTVDGGESWFLLPDHVSRMTLSPNYAVDQIILSANRQGLILSQDGGLSWEPLFEYYLYPEVVGIRMAGPFWDPSAPPPPPPGPHQIYLPLAGKDMGMGTVGLEFWLVWGQPTGSGFECYLYRSHDLEATWEAVMVYEPSHRLYVPLVTTGASK